MSIEAHSAIERNRLVIEEFRANGGRVGGAFAGIGVLLLHTTEASSGAVWVHPLTFQPRGDTWVVVASKSGAPTNPTWYDNLVLTPEVTVEVGLETFAAVADIMHGEERETIWSELKELVPRFAEYERATSRSIPVIVLRRA